MKLKFESKEAVSRRCFVRKGVLRNFAKFTGKHLCQSLFFNKVAGRWLLLNLISNKLNSVDTELKIFHPRIPQQWSK